MPDERQVVAEGYDEIAGRYLKWTTASPTRLKWLQTLMAMLPANARILDLGCGAGIPLASTLADQGHHVTGIDGSRQQIALVRINEPRGQFVVADDGDRIRRVLVRCGDSLLLDNPRSSRLAQNAPRQNSTLAQTRRPFSRESRP